jgi:hypothetical protein
MEHVLAENPIIFSSATCCESGIFANKERTAELQRGQTQPDGEEIHAGNEFPFLDRTVNSRHWITNKSGYGVPGPAGVMPFEKPEAEDDQGEEKGGESQFLTHGVN